MATLPAFLRRFEARTQQEAHRVAAPPRVERDPFALRPLPQEDVFFFCKRIDNSRLVREHDAKAHSTCWSAIGGAAVILVLLTSILFPSVAGTVAHMRLEELRDRERKLTDEVRMLDYQEAELLREDRLVELARKQNLVTPGTDQVYHLETRADGTVAMVK